MIIGNQVRFFRILEPPTPFRDQIRQQVQDRLAQSMGASVRYERNMPVDGDTAQIASIRSALVKLKGIQAQQKAFIEQSQKVKARPMNALEKFRAFADPVIQDVMQLQIQKQRATQAYLTFNSTHLISRHVAAFRA